MVHDKDKAKLEFRRIYAVPAADSTAPMCLIIKRDRPRQARQ